MKTLNPIKNDPRNFIRKGTGNGGRQVNKIILSQIVKPISAGIQGPILYEEQASTLAF